jgi:hypothetical protein
MKISELNLHRSIIINQLKLKIEVLKYGFNGSLRFNNGDLCFLYLALKRPPPLRRN